MLLNGFVTDNKTLNRKITDFQVFKVKMKSNDKTHPEKIKEI